MIDTQRSASLRAGVVLLACGLLFSTPGMDAQAQARMGYEPGALGVRLLGGHCPECQIVDRDAIASMGKIAANADSTTIRECLANKDQRCLATHQGWRDQPAPADQALACNSFMAAHRDRTANFDDGLLARIAQGADDVDEKTLRAFLQACLSSEISPRLKRIVGVFRMGYQIIGMGTLVEADYVVTARHVLYSPGASAELQRWQWPASELTFTLAADPATAIALDPAALQALPQTIDGSSLLQDDVVRIHLARKLAISEAELPVAAPDENIAAHTTLIIASVYQPLLAEQDRVKRAQGKPPIPWRGELVADMQQTCSIVTASDRGCVQHACVTFNGTSGAGVFRRASVEGGPIELVGVHVGTPDSNSCGPLASQFLNVAILLRRPHP